jgi:hypothetical protein
MGGHNAYDKEQAQKAKKTAEAASQLLNDLLSYRIFHDKKHGIALKSVPLGLGNKPNLYPEMVCEIEGNAAYYVFMDETWHVIVDKKLPENKIFYFGCFTTESSGNIRGFIER